MTQAWILSGELLHATTLGPSLGDKKRGHRGQPLKEKHPHCFLQGRRQLFPLPGASQGAP